MDLEAEQSAAFDDSRIGVLCTDASGRIVEANGQFLRMLGYESTQLLGRNFNDIVHPDDRWIDLNVLSDPQPGQAARATFEKRFLTAGGRSVLTAVRASAIGLDTSVAGVVVMVADLKAERESKIALDEKQAQLAQILSSAPMILFAYDRDGVITLCEARSPHAGLLPDALVGLEIWDLVSDQPVAIQHFRSGLAGASGLVNMRIEDVEFNCQYRPIRDAAGLVLGVSGVALDVSELLAASVESQHMADFLAMISHELRTPLNAILGFTELLSSETGGPLNDRQKRYVSHIGSGGRELLSLVNDILDLAKVKAGLMTLAEDPLDVRTVLHSAALQVGVVGEAKGIEIVERPSSAIQFTADGRRVHQILLNLLSNAIKFSPSGGSIELDAHLEDGEVRLSVSDSGPGISPDDLTLIFDEYHQAEAHNRGGTGTGLGLPISRRLAELMGGTLTASSEIGAGSRFVLALPAPQPEEESAE